MIFFFIFFLLRESLSRPSFEWLGATKKPPPICCEPWSLFCLIVNIFFGYPLFIFIFPHFFVKKTCSSLMKGQNLLILSLFSYCLKTFGSYTDIDALIPSRKRKYKIFKNYLLFFYKSLKRGEREVLLIYYINDLWISFFFISQLIYIFFKLM